ncbi:hypothetical protein NQS35_20345 [Ralstonia pseudosolanacearum]|nr:hypothetical protein NQS35_20345 [Ralstonia pseudosolanacearum]
MAAILRGACCLQSRPAMHRIDDLLKNSRQADLANWYRCEGAR